MIVFIISSAFVGVKDDSVKDRSFGTRKQFVLRFMLCGENRLIGCFLQDCFEKT